MKNVKVYRLNDWDGVAAESLEQAKKWYMDMTGLNEEDAFDGYEATEMSLEYEVWVDERMQCKQTLKSIIEEEWEGKPFLVFSSEW